MRTASVTSLSTIEARCSTPTINRKLAALGSFYKFHHRRGVHCRELLSTMKAGRVRGSWRPFLAHLGSVGDQRRRTIKLKTRPRRNSNGARVKGGQREIPVAPSLIRLYADYLVEEYGDLDCDYVFVNLCGGSVGTLRSRATRSLTFKYQGPNHLRRKQLIQPWDTKPYTHGSDRSPPSAYRSSTGNPTQRRVPDPDRVRVGRLSRPLREAQGVGRDVRLRVWNAVFHEYACVRCSLLRPDPAQRPRLEEIRSNLEDRIEEAKLHGWLGEVEGIQVSLAGVKDKLAQIDTSDRLAVDLGSSSLPTNARRR